MLLPIVRFISRTLTVDYLTIAAEERCRVSQMQVLFPLEIIILLYKPILLPLYTSEAPLELLQLVCFYLKQSIPGYTEASNKTGSRNLFTLSHPGSSQ